MYLRDKLGVQARPNTSLRENVSVKALGLDTNEGIHTELSTKPMKPSLQPQPTAKDTEKQNLNTTKNQTLLHNRFDPFLSLREV